MKRYIQKASHACGALDAIVKKLRLGHLQLIMDMQDVEQSIIRQKILFSIPYGNKPDLVGMTKLASEIIAQDVDLLLSSLGSSVFHYAVLAGIQIHGPLDTHLVYPQEFYVVGSHLPGGKQVIPARHHEE